jgi:hypothetical protein
MEYARSTQWMAFPSSVVSASSLRDVDTSEPTSWFQTSPGYSNRLVRNEQDVAVRKQMSLSCKWIMYDHITTKLRVSWLYLCSNCILKSKTKRYLNFLSSIPTTKENKTIKFSSYTAWKKNKTNKNVYKDNTRLSHLTWVMPWQNATAAARKDLLVSHGVDQPSHDSRWFRVTWDSVFEVLQLLLITPSVLFWYRLHFCKTVITSSHFSRNSWIGHQPHSQGLYTHDNTTQTLFRSRGHCNP